MQDRIIVITPSGQSYALDEEDLVPLGDLIFFGGTRMHSRKEAVVVDE